MHFSQVDFDEADWRRRRRNRPKGLHGAELWLSRRALRLAFGQRRTNVWTFFHVPAISGRGCEVWGTASAAIPRERTAPAVKVIPYDGSFTNHGYHTPKAASAT